MGGMDSVETQVSESKLHVILSSISFVTQVEAGD